MIIRKIGERGQVVIPKDIRQMLGVKSGQEIVFEIINNNVTIKSKQDPEEFIEDFFSGPKLKKKLTQKEIKKIILSQYDEEIPRY